MDALLTTSQVAAILGVEVRTVYGLVKRGLLVPVQLGGARRYRLQDVEAAVQACRQEPPARPERVRTATVPVVTFSGWNVVTGRPYGYSREAWAALNTTRAEWEAGQTTGRRGRPMRGYAAAEGTR